MQQHPSQSIHPIPTHPYPDYPYNPRYENKHLLQNTYNFGLAVICMQILIVFIYSFVIVTPGRDIALYEPAVAGTGGTAQMGFMGNVAPIFVVVCTGIFVVVGFGLFFGYNRHLVMSALGFNLLMTVLTIQWYFLFNAFWNKCAQSQGTTFTQPLHKIYLTNLQYLSSTLTSPSILAQQSTRIRSTLTQALKCALSNFITFSAILGRAGPLEVFIVGLIGTIGYQLNCGLVVGRIGIDYGWCYRVFLFGGVCGLVMGWMLRSRHETNIQQLTKHHPNYTSSNSSTTLSLLGMTLICIFFPIFLLDPPYQHATIEQTYSPISTCLVSVLHAMAASTLTAVGLSIFIHGKLAIRDFLFGPIAGGIAVASALPYLVEPVWPILIGTISGAIQCLSNLYQKHHSQRSNIVNTFSFTLFGFNSILGSIWSTIFRAAIVDRPKGQVFLFENLKPPGNQFLAALATIGMGICFGFILGVVVLWVGGHRRGDYFRDYAYWSRNDGLSEPIEREQQIKLFCYPDSTSQTRNPHLITTSKPIHPSQTSLHDPNPINTTQNQGKKQDYFQDNYRDQNQLRIWVQIGQDIEKKKLLRKQGREEAIMIRLEQ